MSRTNKNGVDHGYVVANVPCACICIRTWSMGHVSWCLTQYLLVDMDASILSRRQNVDQKDRMLVILGLEPRTTALLALRSTDWAIRPHTHEQHTHKITTSSTSTIPTKHFCDSHTPHTSTLPYTALVHTPTHTIHAFHFTTRRYQPFSSPSTTHVLQHLYNIKRHAHMYTRTHVHRQVMWSQ